MHDGAGDRVVPASLIEWIYEAAVDVRRWPLVLDAVARSCGARGAMIMNATPDRVRWTASEPIAGIVDQFFADGWHLTGGRADPLLADHYPGFRVETDYRTVDELAAMPVQRDFLAPHGMIGGAGSLFQGLLDDAAIFTLEGFQSHAAARAAVPFLDTLRPHLGRALSLAARFEDRVAGAMVDALAVAGVPAIVIGREGHQRACNAAFEQGLAAHYSTAPASRTVRFHDRRLQAAVDTVIAGAAGGRSIPLAVPWNDYPAAAHVLPLHRGARDFFDSDGAIVVLASSANATLPDADLLRLMFDLTPTEARLTRSLLEGATITEAARRHRVTASTARRQLASIFAKTGANRQVDLLRLLSGLGGVQDPPSERP